MSDVIIGTLSSMISLAVILLIAAEGEIVVERSGQFDMGIEGIMISSALGSFVVTYFTGSIFLGFLTGAVIGALMGLSIFLLINKFELNPILVAVIFNLLSSGVTGFLTVRCINTGSVPAQCAKLEPIKIPFLSEIPYVGKILFEQNIIVYLAFIAVPILSYYLFKTRQGLEIRAVGEDEVAAGTNGIDVYAVKRKSFVIGCVSAGVAGSYVSLTMGVFMDGMTANKGFISLALCAFSGKNPVGTLVGSLFFSLVDSIQIRLQLFDFGIPYEFMVSLPYVLTILALLFTSEKIRKLKKKTVKETAANETENSSSDDDAEYNI